jgi:predicted dehydrogenase
MSDPIRVGIVGAGAIAQVAHLPALARSDQATVVSICDNDRAKAQSLAQRFDIPNAFDDIEDLLKVTTPDAVIICTPNHLHEIHVKTALSAHAHVLCERPLGLSADGIRDVLAEKKRVNRSVMVGMNYRFREDVQNVRALLANDELGRIHTVRSGWYTFRPSRHSLGWRRRRAQSGGGAVLDLGLGLLDLTLHVLGDAPPISVSAAFANKSGDRAEVEDSGCALIRFADGVTALVDVSWAWVGESERFWFGVHGSEGSAAISPLRVYKAMHGSAVDVTPAGADGRDAFMTSYTAQWANFVGIVRGTLHEPDLGDQVMLHQLLDAVYLAAAEGRTVEV